MRKAKELDGDRIISIYGWTMIPKIGWEYWFLTDSTEDIQLALVEGYEQEMGDVSLREIKPYAMPIAKGKELFNLAPPKGWEWV